MIIFYTFHSKVTEKKRKIGGLGSIQFKHFTLYVYCILTEKKTYLFIHFLVLSKSWYLEPFLTDKHSTQIDVHLYNHNIHILFISYLFHIRVTEKLRQIKGVRLFFHNFNQNLKIL